MSTETTPQAERAARRAKAKRQTTAAGAFWRRIRQSLAESTFVKSALVNVFVQFLRLVRLTTKPVAGSVETIADHAALEPGIIALWHGQHLMAPVFYPSKRQLAAMVSRSADAELNAKVIEAFGFEAVRGSGGRRRSSADKGGATALIALKRALDEGKNVCMIADIPNGKPRDSGMGVILLARLSGRPILPVAMTTSRRKIVERSWDKTAINLPFGRRCIMIGEPVYVPADADDAAMEEYRLKLTGELNETTARAMAAVGTAS